MNVIWQADANAMTLRALASIPERCRVLNLAGPEILRVRHIASRLGGLLGKAPQFLGEEGQTALLSDGREGYKVMGRPPTTSEVIMRMTADWVARGGESLGKPTHFDVRDGTF